MQSYNKNYDGYADAPGRSASYDIKVVTKVTEIVLTAGSQWLTQRELYLVVQTSNPR